MLYALTMPPAEAVAAGAQLLDERMPGWWRKVTLEQLNLASCRDCVCGQLASDAAVQSFAHQRQFEVDFWNGYHRTVSFLDLTWCVSGEYEGQLGHDWEYGFNVATSEALDMEDMILSDEWEALTQRTYRALDVEWRLVIEARLEADQLAAEQARQFAAEDIAALTASFEAGVAEGAHASVS